jgi:hypothetical protein
MVHLFNAIHNNKYEIEFTVITEKIYNDRFSVP